MSTTTQPPAAAPPSTLPAPDPHLSVSVAANSRSSSLRARLQETPRILSLFTAIVVVICLLFGVAGTTAFITLATALGRAKDNTEQLIRVQQIQSNLLRADATATNAFLVGGLEPLQQRARYDQALADTAALIAQAAEAQPADRDALASLNTALVSYAATIEQARANNRQGFPVGSTYLRNASATLRADALPTASSLVTANVDRAEKEMAVRTTAPYVATIVATLAILIFVMVWVARRFRRTINLGLLAATVTVVISSILSLLALGQVDRRLHRIQASDFNSVVQAADARIQANNAKANESLTLIARGSGAEFELAWEAADFSVQQSLDQIASHDPAIDPVIGAWASYTTTHKQIRSMDDGGTWEKAVEVATGSQETSSNATFRSFDTKLSEYLDSVNAQTASRLGLPRTRLTLGAVALMAASIAAAIVARNGLLARLKEYR